MNADSTSTRAHVSRILGELGRSLNVDLSLDSDDACFFEHKDGWQMAILLPSEHQIVTAVSVLSNIEAPDADIWPALTEFGWVGAETDGAALSWNPESRSIVLWYSRDVQVTTAMDLNDLLLRLCRTAAVLEQALSAGIYSRTDVPGDVRTGSPMVQV